MFVVIVTEHASVGSVNSSVSIFAVKNAPSYYSDPPPPYNTSYYSNEYTPDASTDNAMHGGTPLVPPPDYFSIVPTSATVPVSPATSV